MEKKSWFKKLSCILLVATLVCALSACSTYEEYVATSGNGVPEYWGNIVLEIQTDSMYPTFSAGDRIICEKVAPTTLQAGDIITYWTIIDGERVLNTHRIVEIYDGGGYLIFVTKGDNNNSEDALTVHESEIVGKYVRKAFLGYF